MSKTKIVIIIVCVILVSLFLGGLLNYYWVAKEYPDKLAEESPESIDYSEVDQKWTRGVVKSVSFLAGTSGDPVTRVVISTPDMKQDMVVDIDQDVKLFRMERIQGDIPDEPSSSLDPNTKDDPPSIETFGYKWESASVNDLEIGQTIYIYSDSAVTNGEQRKIKEVHLHNF